jgi:hypothetical protein
MQVTSDDQIVPIKDRVLYWPTVLAVFWSTLFITHDRGGPGLDFAPILISLGWLMSAGIVAMISFAWIYQRAWRRVLSAMILPLSVVLLVYYWGG